MGLWYGAEVITHHDGEEFEATYDSCVVLHLAEVTNEVSSTFKMQFAQILKIIATFYYF